MGIAVSELSPRLLCSAVYRYLAGELHQGGARVSGGASKLSVIRAMQKDPSGARAFMAWVIEQEQRSPEERAADKETAEAEGKRRYMEGQPPTEKQLAVLVKLGVTEHPENRWRASELIEAHKTW